MQSALLEGHYGQRIEVDLCAGCHLAWFDDTESVRLSGLGWIALLRGLHAAPEQTVREVASPLGCVRCGTPLKPIRNLSRFGRTSGHECPRGHGYFQTFGQLLAERGLVRPLEARDRCTLLRQSRSLACLNCGAALSVATATDACAYCGSTLLVLDVKRLLASLMVRHGLPLPPDAAEPVAWACRACGDAVDPTRMTVCPRCGHAVLAPSLVDAVPFFDALEPQLREMRPRAPRPHGERLRERRSFRDTAFYRLVVAPLGHAGLARELDFDPGQRSRAKPRRKRVAPVAFDWYRLLGMAILFGMVVAVLRAVWGR
jgi:DNA-directed RNA polymerase subunit RPC12/RpoP